MTTVTTTPAVNNLRVVAANYGEAVALNTGVSFALNLEGETDAREFVLVKLDASSALEQVDGRKLHSVILADITDGTATVTLAPAAMIALLNDADKAIGEPIGNVILPAAPLAATKKPKAEVAKEPRGPSKKELCRQIYLDALTRARLLGQAAPARKDVIAMFAPILTTMAKAGQDTYYNTIRNEVHTAEQMKESEIRVRKALEEENVEIPEIASNNAQIAVAPVTEPSDEEVAAKMAASEEQQPSGDDEEALV